MKLITKKEKLIESKRNTDTWTIRLSKAILTQEEVAEELEKNCNFDYNRKWNFYKNSYDFWVWVVENEGIEAQYFRTSKEAKVFYQKTIFDYKN